MSTLIAERQLDYFTGDKIEPGAVRFFAPEDEGSNWRCRYEIEWPGFSRRFGAAGVDFLQALTLALKIVPIEIQVTDDFKAGRIGSLGERINSVAELNEAIGIAPMKGFEQ